MIASVSSGVVHTVPKDLVKSLHDYKDSLLKWESLTPLARNEWICWVEGAKLIETRQRRIMRVITELVEGKRRPCCWPGCIHRVKIPKSK